MPALTVEGKSLVAQDEVQTIQVLNATDGKFKLTFALDVDNNGRIDASERVTTAAAALIDE